MITFGTPETLNPKGKALAIEAWVKAEKNDGVIVARGGPKDGFAITVEKGNSALSHTGSPTNWRASVHGSGSSANGTMWPVFFRRTKQ